MYEYVKDSPILFLYVFKNLNSYVPNWTWVMCTFQTVCHIPWWHVWETLNLILIMLVDI